MKPGALSGSSNHKDHSFAPTSVPTGLLVKVESIFIDIFASEQIQAKRCEHFTIRGFVSDSREQNEKLCSPLFLDADAAGSEEINTTLYPLHAPHFKSWRCQNCLNDIKSAVGKNGSRNISASCSKQLKSKRFRSQRSLENVGAYLSEKLKRTSELGRNRTLRQGVKPNSMFKQKPKRKQKQRLDLALYSNSRGLEEDELDIADTGFISNQQDSLTCVGGHHKESLGPPRTSISPKLTIVDGSQHKARSGAVTKLVQRQHDDLVGSGCRKSKAKKVRLLNEILEKDGNGKGSRLAMTKGFHIDETVNASCSASQSMQKFQFDSVRCQAGQKRNNNDQEQEQDRILSQMHHANTVLGNYERRKAQGLNSTYANELHVTSNDGRSNPIIGQADKMFLGRKRRVEGHKDYPHGGIKTTNNSYPGEEKLSTCQSFHCSVGDSLHNDSVLHSQFKGKSNGTIHKVHEGANLLSPTDIGRGPENNVTLKRMETIQIGQAKCVKPMQDDNSSGQDYAFAEGCSDPRKGILRRFPNTQNDYHRSDTKVYMGQSSSACKSLVGKNTCEGTNSISALKRPSPKPFDDNKKPKHSQRTEGGPAAVHQTELLLRNTSKKMRGMRGSPESTLCEVRGNLRQEVGTSDDIPMEIVELMAKNQYERHLHEVGDNHYKQQSGSYRKKDLMGRTSMLSSHVSHGPLHEKPGLLSPHITSEENLRISNGKPIGNILQKPTGSTHIPLIQGQRELYGVLQFPAMSFSSSKADIFQIPNSKYDVNKSASEQRVPSRSQGQFELWQPSSRQSDRTDRPWPIVPPNNLVHKASALEGNALRSYNYGEIPKFSSYVSEGQAFCNLALAGKNNNFMPEASNSSHPVSVDSRTHMSGSPDPYANEAIPAMNLLSLMNGRPQSNSPIYMDSVANRKTFDRSFSNDHLAKELSGNSFAVGKSGHKLKQPSPYGYQSKNPHSEASCQCSPPIPTFSSAAASVHGDVADKMGFQPLSRHQERIFSDVNSGGSLLPNENRSIIYQQSSLTSTVGVACQQLIPAHELANHIFSHSWPVPCSTHLFLNGNFNGYHSLVANESFDTLDKRAEHGVCCLNQNPMEFSTPGPGNEFMIGPEELRLRKTYPPKFSRPVPTSSFKQQGFIKYAAPNNRL